MTNQGQISYLKAYHRLGGWFPGSEVLPAFARTQDLVFRGS